MSLCSSTFYELCQRLAGEELRNALSDLRNEFRKATVPRLKKWQSSVTMTSIASVADLALVVHDNETGRFCSNSVHKMVVMPSEYDELFFHDLFATLLSEGCIPPAVFTFEICYSGSSTGHPTTETDQLLPCVPFIMEVGSVKYEYVACVESSVGHFRTQMAVCKDNAVVFPDGTALKPAIYTLDPLATNSCKRTTALPIGYHKSYRDTGFFCLLYTSDAADE